MKRTVVIICFTLIHAAVFAQIDSLRLKPQKRVFDSLSRVADIRFSTDSLLTNAWGDSLRFSISRRFNSDSSVYKNKIDSLQSLGLPTYPYSEKLDSVIQKRNSMFGEVRAKQEKLLAAGKTRVEEWKQKVAWKLGVSKVPETPQLPGIPQGSLPDLNLPTDIPMQVPGMPEVNIPEMPAIMPNDFGSELSPDLSKINAPLPFNNPIELGEIQGKLNTDALKELGSGNPDKLIESSVDKIGNLGAVKEKLDVGMPANQFTETAEMMKDPEAIQGQVKEQIMEKAVNHFEGKEQVLQEAMDKIAKYKQKYESINSLSEIKKRPPNPMKGKPFIERVVPGIALQLQQRNDLMLDVNPYAGYRITGRLSSGLGWNQRIGYRLDENYFTSMAVIYGPRIFVEFKVWKGFTGRGEIEWMNTAVPSRLGAPLNDLSKREWVRSVFVGMKKEYRFMKSVKGTAFIMFNLFNPEHKSPYGDVVNTRFGFEFPMKKKKKQQ